MVHKPSGVPLAGLTLRGRLVTPPMPRRRHLLGVSSGRHCHRTDCEGLAVRTLFAVLLTVIKDWKQLDINNREL